MLLCLSVVLLVVALPFSTSLGVIVHVPITKLSKQE